MPDAFLWYHADAEREPALLNWIERVEAHAGVRGRLYIRKQEQRTTFMECYRDVSSATIRRIEALAAADPLFEQIERRCESFVEIT